MALNLKNAEIERLAAEVAALAGETKTEAIRRALIERRDRLAFQRASEDPGARLHRFLVEEVWPLVPPEAMGRPLSRDEEDALLGYGEDGV